MAALMKYDLIKATNNLYVSIQIASIWKTNQRERVMADEKEEEVISIG